jgi:2OG-Fe(II) oxygenase superfamily
VTVSAGARPVLQLTRRGSVWHDDGALPGLRDEFTTHHSVLLPALVEPQLLARIQADIARAQFREFAHGAIATELKMQPNASIGLLQFLVNDRALYRLVENVSGCRPIRMFQGRVYRRLPGQHHDSWHTDVHEERLVGMSLNLSAEPYEGGAFEIRRADTERLLVSIANTGLGDAHLFRISPALEHRVTDVRGTRPKTAYAGWFGGVRDYHSEFREDPYVTDQP